MAGLCEGGNESPGSLKAIDETRRFVSALHAPALGSMPHSASYTYVRQLPLCLVRASLSPRAQELRGFVLDSSTDKLDILKRLDEEETISGIPRSTIYYWKRNRAALEEYCASTSSNDKRRTLKQPSVVKYDKELFLWFPEQRRKVAICGERMSADTVAAEEYKTTFRDLELREAYADAALPYRTVARWVKTFREGRDAVQDNLHTGRPRVEDNTVQLLASLLDADGLRVS
ncbi:hypothetical protein ANN_20416 [Periplaneta americana]|uniref:Mos1 transposase HTH domain-containing protein n=1 Tax=Periplaneta americana TaxID=6978 RepID=A0ABQ8SDP1_PERAM|nr:hypothetical protein ANN_20416 [Periplaneta americana]